MTKAFVPGTVSHGTLNLYDLANAFLEALETVAPAAYQQLAFPAGITPDYLRAIDEGRSADYWATEDAGWFVNECLFDALNDAAPEGYCFGAHEGDGADFGFWETEEYSRDRDWERFVSDLAEESKGRHRKVHLTDSGPLNERVTADSDRFVVFAFGAYGATYVAVPYENTRPGVSIEDALEEAASKLLDVAPGMFTDLEMDATRDEMLADGELTEEQHADRDSDEVQDMVHERASVDMTYTESGYIASWEWTIVGEAMTRAELLAFARGA
jgi:hypothetical protein